MMTLIVCTMNRTQELSRLLASLGQQEDPGFTVVLVDQNPAGFLSPVIEAAPRLRLRHVFSPKGLSRARNVGLEHAQDGVVAFPDDDCWYPPGLVRDVKAAFAENDGLDVLVGRTVDAQGRESVSSHLPESGPLSKRRIFQAGNSNAIFARARIAKACGGFDESLGVGAGTIFGAGEETEFLLKCLQRGARIHYRRDILVHHDQVARDRSRIKSYASGFGRVCRLHGLGGRTLAPTVARAALRGAALAATGRRVEAEERWAWISGSVRGFLSRRAV